MLRTLKNLLTSALAAALLLAVPLPWAHGAPRGVSATFRDFVVVDGTWRARFELKNNTGDRAVTRVDFRGDFRLNGEKHPFVKAGEDGLKLDHLLLPGKTFTLTLETGAPEKERVEKAALAILSYSHVPVPRPKTSQTTQTAQSAAGAALGEKLAQSVQKHLGAKYVWGGSSPKGFDCSGLVQYVFRQHGIRLPRTSVKQSKVGKPVAKKDLRPGDLVFFSRRASGPVDHVGVYIGNDTFVHAVNRRNPVVKTRLSDNCYEQKGKRCIYKGRYVTARRVTP